MAECLVFQREHVLSYFKPLSREQLESVSQDCAFKAKDKGVVARQAVTRQQRVKACHMQENVSQQEASKDHREKTNSGKGKENIVLLSTCVGKEDIGRT